MTQSPHSADRIRTNNTEGTIHARLFRNRHRINAIVLVVLLGLVAAVLVDRWMKAWGVRDWEWWHYAIQTIVVFTMYSWWKDQAPGNSEFRGCTRVLLRVTLPIFSLFSLVIGVGVGRWMGFLTAIVLEVVRVRTTRFFESTPTGRGISDRMFAVVGPLMWVLYWVLVLLGSVLVGG